MSLSSVLQSAISGMSAAELMLGAASDNIANSQTVGFKASRPTFASQAFQTLRVGTGPSVESGGSNPVQIGLGVRSSGMSIDLTRGAIVGGGELSNSDIGQSLVDLTLASFQFLTNAGEFLAASGLLDELVHLRRVSG